MIGIGNLPYFELEIDKAGHVLEGVPLPVPLPTSVTDLFVMAHGWNANMEDARLLYTGFFSQFSKTLAAQPMPGLTDGRSAVLGVLWPSRKCSASSQIPGGAASLNEIGLICGHEVAARIDRAKSLLPVLGRNPQACREFVALVRSLVVERRDDEGTHCLFEHDGDELLGQLYPPPSARCTEEGGAADIGNWASEIQRAAALFLNTTAYYLMKDRAGVVGRNGLAQTLDRIGAARPGLRIHLIGHSFGCRVVTSACTVMARPVDTLTLLQAAFSHNSFSPDYDSTHRPGGFRSVITDRKCRGPILVTHSRHDLAVGLGYAVASRVAGECANALGGGGDLYGGLGCNGARHTPEASDDYLLPEGGHYAFLPGHITNLAADTVIKSHSDIVKPETVWAVIAATTAFRPRNVR